MRLVLLLPVAFLLALACGCGSGTSGSDTGSIPEAEWVSTADTVCFGGALDLGPLKRRIDRLERGPEDARTLGVVAEALARAARVEAATARRLRAMPDPPEPIAGGVGRLLRLLDASVGVLARFPAAIRAEDEAGYAALERRGGEIADEARPLAASLGLPSCGRGFR